MNKSRNFAFATIGVVLIILSAVTWTLPVRASDSETTSSNSDEERIKNIVQEYFEIRYRLFNTLQLEGFGVLISNQPEANTFLDAELGKLAVEIKHAELNRLRYIDYKFFLDYKNIIISRSRNSL